MKERYLKDSTSLNVIKAIGKILFYIILVILFFLAGIFIGYAVIGDGNFWEALNRDTWQHIVDFIS
ncbi:DNA-directed RNA polymerase subunit beta [Fundicoccus ignavus]|uniref:DNA-directed RNA polymerase subunit beta n=1 Tax=Fundicoccus ignavus TaxID=2664442 RepID=A0A844C6T2_9LACT|nr:DNA-directed RNA polymerase subunit beta [Fundicoccus ignavus]MRJ46766.1 DNA-directed RNA polymerase subunit beta [Fundicoccus ignavus]